MYDHLPTKEKLTRHKNVFKCELCSQVIGEQPDKNGDIKPESVTEYYRIKLEDPIQFVFCCPTCSYKY